MSFYINGFETFLQVEQNVKEQTYQQVDARTKGSLREIKSSFLIIEKLTPKFFFVN